MPFLWSALWFRASNVTQETLQGWFDREARTGRLYSCGAPRIGGFPFRIEVHCAPAAMEWRGDAPPVFVQTAGMLVAAQVYQPSLLISEFEGPLTMADAPGRPTYTANWKLLQTSVRGAPAPPERASIAMDEPVFERVTPSGNEKLFNAAHAELHGRIVEGSAAGNPVIDLVLKLPTPRRQPSIRWRRNRSMPNHLRAARVEGFLAETLAGALPRAAGRRRADRHHQCPRAAGRNRSRLATGSLALTDDGHLDGQLLITVAGLDRLLPALGLDKLVAPGGKVDRSPGRSTG